MSRVDVGRQVYSACLQAALARLRTLRASPAWARPRALPRDTDKQRARRARAFARARKRYGLTEHALQRVALTHFRRSGWMCSHLGTHEVQKIGTRAYLAVTRILLDHSRSARFKGPGQFHSLEGKSNATGIRWRGDHVHWRGLALPAIIKRGDPVAEHALTTRVKYVRIVLRRVRGVPRVYAQLVCQGHPYRKPKNRIGCGHVGVDLGPSTIAVAAPQTALLTRFCDPVVRRRRQIRVLQRRLDRQRRAATPDTSLPDGRVRRGVTRGHASRRERAVRDRLADLFRRERAHRKTLHGQLANEILRMGNTIRIEKTPIRSLQRAFGRSMSVRAPGLCVQILRRKAESAGGQVIDIPARVATLSQTCHGCEAARKKPLHQRVHACASGVELQRDLHSAFLAAHTDAGGALHAGRARRAWPGAEPLLRAAWSEAVQPARGRPVPSPFGGPVACRSQSGSLAPGGTANAEARGGTTPGEAAVVPLRTPPGFSRGEVQFVNTMSGSRARPTERLTAYRDLLLWARQAGVLVGPRGAAPLARRRAGSRRGERVLEEAVRFREALFRIFAAVASRRSPPRDDLALLNLVLSRALAHQRVERTEGGFAWGWAEAADALVRMLWPVARSAADLLVSPDVARVKKCAGPTCDWLFVDMSRNRSRRWCDMRECGNRAKARRYSARHRGGRAGAAGEDATGPRAPREPAGGGRN